jgi:hypothetical protein
MKVRGTGSMQVRYSTPHEAATAETEPIPVLAEQLEQKLHLKSNMVSIITSRLNYSNCGAALPVQCTLAVDNRLEKLPLELTNCSKHHAGPSCWLLMAYRVCVPSSFIVCADLYILH